MVKFSKFLGILSEPIEKFYKLGNVTGLSPSYIIREAVDINNPEAKVFVRSLEWDSIEAKPEEYLNVLKNLKNIDHQNISGIIHFYSDLQFLYIVTENTNGLYLQEYIEANTWSEELVVIIIHQILDAVRYLHNYGFLNNNITPKSIKIDPETLEIKLENFDLPYKFEGPASKFIDYKSGSRVTLKSLKDDLRSICLILSKISTKKDEITKDFMKKCWLKDKDQRITIDQALKHNVFNFRSTEKSIYKNGETRIWSLSSIHDSINSSISEFFVF